VDNRVDLIQIQARVREFRGEAILAEQAQNTPKHTAIIDGTAVEVVHDLKQGERGMVPTRTAPLSPSSRGRNQRIRHL
jgi:hypothetical protein